MRSVLHLTAGRTELRSVTWVTGNPSETHSVRWLMKSCFRKDKRLSRHSGVVNLGRSLFHNSRLTVGQMLPESQLELCCPMDNELRLWQCLTDRQLFSFIILECRSDTVNNFLLYDSYMILSLWQRISNRKYRKKVIQEVAVRKKLSMRLSEGKSCLSVG